jgi:putative spermidine/putrescine transport system permease protein
MKKNSKYWSWLWIILGVVYFFLPLIATFDFSLRAKKGVLSFLAYSNVTKDPRFLTTFSFSAEMAFLTIIFSILLVVPTAYWVNLRLPKLRPVIEFITLMPFVIPAIVLVFGLIRSYSKPPFLFVSSPLLLVAAYTVLSLPYMYRAVDTGLRAIDVRSLTEAAQSLGASWPTILWRVIFPNLRVSMLSGAFLTFAIVIGEYTIAIMLAWHAFGPYMVVLGQDLAYEPAALAIMSFLLTWILIGLIQLVGRGTQGRNQLGGIH